MRRPSFGQDRRRTARDALCVALVLVGGACVVSVDGDSASAGDSADADEPPGATIEWVYSADGCGDAYGVVHRGDEAIVVGNLEGSPWAIRLAADGTPVWSHSEPEREGAYFAVDVGELGDDPSVEAPVIWAVGRYEDAGGERYGLVTGLDDGGAIDLELDDVGGAGIGLFAITGDDGGGLPVVAGIRDSFDVLVARLDPLEGILDPWVAPAGQGPLASVAFGVRAAAAADGGVLACGRASAGEGGVSWVGRYALDGALLWDALGPPAPIGASMECWALAALEGGGAAVVDRGYLGGRVAAYDGAGELLWERDEPNTGAQAIDAGAGQLFVGGWSANPEAEPYRSHDTGALAGWVIALSDAGEFLWQTDLVDALSLYALRYHPDGYLTVVGTRDPFGTCPYPWIARLRLP
ncbi:MAG: hypothetical protein R3A79_20520 [Nannocystaceae bacterium]